MILLIHLVGGVVGGEGAMALPLPSGGGSGWSRVACDASTSTVTFEAGCLWASGDGMQQRKFMQRQYDSNTGFLTKLILGKQERCTR